MNRFPFPMPFGWFQVCYPEDIPEGRALPLYYFGQHLVAWRDGDGDTHVNDAFCPHLGAHLGHGGTVEGCDLVCPFHGWAFDAEGNNTNIPYSERVNRKAGIRSYPTIVRNGKVMVWYHPDEAEPLWEIPEVEELATGEFSGPMRTHYRVHSALQEMAENSVDSAHFRYVHNTAIVPEIVSYDIHGHVADMKSVQKFPTPRGVVDGKIETVATGPGFNRVWFSGIVDTLLVTSNTPVDDQEVECFFDFYVRKIGDEDTTSNVGKAFVAEVDKQFREDTPIWEHKAHLVRPALADNDGPFMKFRKWYSQFYVDHADGDERTVYPPPYWPDKMDESPAKATASARYGD